MAVFTKTVHKVFTKSKGNRSWMGILVDGKDGGTKEENVFDDNVKAAFSAGPGVYELTYEKGEKYWNLTGAKALKTSGAVPQNQENGSVTPKSGLDESIRAQVFSAALNAAVHIVTANKGKTDTDDTLTVKAKGLTVAFVKFGAELVKNGLPKAEVVIEEGPEADVEGA